MQDNGWVTIFHADDLVQGQIDWREALQAQREYVGKFRLKNPQGGYTWFIGKTALLTNQRGEILNLAVTCTNIDELKGLETELTSSEKSFELNTELIHEQVEESLVKRAQEFQRLADNIPDIISRHDST